LRPSKHFLVISVVWVSALGLNIQNIVFPKNEVLSLANFLQRILSFVICFAFDVSNLDLPLVSIIGEYDAHPFNKVSNSAIPVILFIIMFPSIIFF
jgi:hypothetical protein